MPSSRYALRCRGPPPDPYENASYEKRLKDDLLKAFRAIGNPGAFAAGQALSGTPSSDLQKGRIRETLRYWLQDLNRGNTRDVPSHLYHCLEHSHTEIPFSLRKFKNENSKLVQVIQELAEEVHLEIFFVQLEKKHRVVHREHQNLSNSGKHAESDLNASHDPNCLVKTLRALDGTNIASGYSFVSKFCMDDCFDDGKNASKCGGGDGQTAHRHHHSTALLIVPHEAIAEYMAQVIVESTAGCKNNDAKYGSTTSKNCHSALRYVKRVFPDPSAQAHILDTILLSKSRKEQQITEIMKKSFEFSNLTLFQAVAAGHEGLLPISFFDWAKEWLDTLSETDRATKYQKWIPFLIQGYPFVAQRIGIIRKLTDTTGDAAAPHKSLIAMARGAIRQCIMNFPAITEKLTVYDGESIVSALFNLNEAWVDISVLLKSIFICLQQTDATAFLLAVLACLKERGLSAGVPMSDIAQLYRSLSLYVFNGKSKLSDIAPAAKTKRPKSSTGPEVTPEALVRFACGLQDLSPGKASFLHPFIEEINAQCHTFSAQDMRNLWVPFFYQLIPALVSRSIPLNTSPYQNLARQIVIRLENKTTGPYPQTVDLPNSEVSCGCEDCKSLNKFFRDVSRGVTRFPVTQAQCLHLKKQIKLSHIPCTHRTDKSDSSIYLVITKYHYSHDQIAAWNNWKNELYCTLVSKIPSEHLRSLLGPQEAARVQSSVELEKHLSRLTIKDRGSLPGY